MVDPNFSDPQLLPKKRMMGQMLNMESLVPNPGSPDLLSRSLHEVPPKRGLSMQKSGIGTSKGCEFAPSSVLSSVLSGITL